MAGLRLSLSLLAVALVCGATAAQLPEFPRRMVGAPVAVDNPENDEGVEDALRFAMEKYNEANNDLYASRVVRILSAKKQIVAGIKYLMEVEIARTACEKPAADPQNCALPDSPQLSQRTICKFVVYVVPWMNKTELLQRECK